MRWRCSKDRNQQWSRSCSLAKVFAAHQHSQQLKQQLQEGNWVALLASGFFYLEVIANKHFRGFLHGHTNSREEWEKRNYRNGDNSALFPRVKRIKYRGRMGPNLYWLFSTTQLLSKRNLALKLLNAPLSSPASCLYCVTDSDNVHMYALMHVSL